MPRMIGKTYLLQLYEAEVERPFGKAGERTLSDGQVIEIVTKWRDDDRVWNRCVEYLKTNPRDAYISRPVFSDIYHEILPKSDARVLEVGSFLGNEIRQFHRDGLQGHIMGMDLNPWHYLAGFLVHNDSPQSYANVEFAVGNVCRMRAVPDDSFDYVYSNGLIQSLGKRTNVGVHLKEAHRVLKPNGLMFGNTFLKDSNVRGSLIRLDKDKLIEELVKAEFEISRLEEGESPRKGRLVYFFVRKV